MMKKILVALLLCALLVVMPLSVSAEENAPNEGEITTEGDNNTPENETPTEGENSGDEDYGIGDVFEEEIPGVTDTETPEETPDVGDIWEGEVPEETPTETPEDNESVKDTVMDGLDEAEKDEIESIADKIVKYIEAHLDTISLFITVILSIFYQIRKHASLNKTIGVLNNNAITVAEKSTGFMSQALVNMETASNVVTGYDEKIANLLEAFKTTAEDKARLEREIVEMKSYLRVATQANVEFANELAELLALANIPNYKKEELGSRHVEYVNAIIEAAANAENMLPTTTEEVKEDVGEKA